MCALQTALVLRVCHLYCPQTTNYCPCKMSASCRSNSSVASGSFYSSSVGNTIGVSSHFVQVLDESMCVIREDICDWLQRYVFSEAHVAPLDNPCDLLERLKSGVWLARLAHKLHFKVLAANLPRTRGVKVTSREHKLYASLRGTGPSNALGQLTAENLPVFSQPLKHAAESRLSQSDVATGDFAPTPLGNPFCDSAPAVNDLGVRLRNHWAARGNISAFLEWCHALGISETVLFETTGLVNRTEEKNVLLTLMDLARLASRFGLAELPELVRMEREIEALEAAAAEAESSSVGTMAGEHTKVDASVYASHVLERKLSMTSVVSSPPHSPGFASASLSSPSYENDFYDSSISSTTTEPVIRYCSTNTVGTTAAEVLVDVSTGVDEEEREDKSLEAGQTDSSTLVERVSSDGTSTTVTNTTLISDAIDASCQAKANKSTRGVSAGKKSTNNNATTVTVLVDVGESGDAADKSIRTATLPPLKASQTTPKVKPRGVKKTTLPRVNVGTNSRAEIVKRSTSAADLRELEKSQAKRRNTREGRDGATQRGRPVKSQGVTKSTATANKAASAGQQPRSCSQVRTPLADRNQVGQTRTNSQLPHSASSSSKLSSGFASRSSSCSDVAAESRPSVWGDLKVAKIWPLVQLSSSPLPQFSNLGESHDICSAAGHLVRRQTAHCTCCARNRLIRLDEGRYQMGSRIYYLRRFHSHVMVRVGGGWLTLNQFLDRYDPCRQKEGKLQSITSSSFNVNGEARPMILVPASNILEEWPSKEVLKTNSRPHLSGEEKLELMRSSRLRQGKIFVIKATI
ncbi:GAS2-like protein 3 [Echinococcus granulosus]|uniref:GAS2-like protein 3 n=1 Tax=Echinococcus granulosus TaxID=6210 RepID=W6V1F9_ECHGR|nr:GAS2-like protein 3 [Echinococcus granulosus]EUB59699.1 GAS2-like protein 3 [Echinococcus granulosus]